MNEAQTWVVIGLMATLTIGGTGLLVTFFDRQLRLTRDLLLVRIDGLAAKVDGIETRIDGLGAKIDALDKDVQAIASKVFGSEHR